MSSLFVFQWNWTFFKNYYSVHSRWSCISIFWFREEKRFHRVRGFFFQSISGLKRKKPKSSPTEKKNVFGKIVDDVIRILHTRSVRLCVGGTIESLCLEIFWPSSISPFPIIHHKSEGGGLTYWIPVIVCRLCFVLKGSAKPIVFFIKWLILLSSDSGVL